MAFVYITCKDAKEAKKISISLLQMRLIACSNFFPINSLYWWNGKIQASKESVIILKTKKQNFNKIKEEVKKIHSYKIPCISLIDSKSNEEFENWVNNEIK